MDEIINSEDILEIPFLESPSFVKVPILRGIEEIEPLWNMINHDEVVICGGYARFCASSREKPVKAGDVDLFPKTEEASENLITLLLRKGFEKCHENDVSFTFLKNSNFPTLPTVQVIKPMNEGAIKTIGTLEEILSNFDFTITRIGLLSKTEALADVNFLEDEEKRLLRFKNIHCPISSLIRTMKYGRKGYYIRPAEVMKLFSDWDARDDRYRSNIYELFKTSALGEISEEEINELEKLMRID